MKRILFFKIGAIGDVLMTTPLVRQVRKNFPNVKIDYLVGRIASEVLKNNKNINAIYRFDESVFFNKKVVSYLNLIQKIRRKTYDAIFVLDKSWVFNLTAWMFGIKTRIGFDRLGKEGVFLTHKVRYQKVRHEILYYLDLLNSLNQFADYQDVKMDLKITQTDSEVANRLLKKHNLHSFVVLINSGGTNRGETTKIRMLPDKLFRSLVKEASKKNKIIFLGSSKERSYYDQFYFSNCFNFCGQTSIAQSAQILKSAKKIITTDCGPMHLAATVNSKIVSIFGPTNPKRKAPLNKNSKCIWKDQDLYNEAYELYGLLPKNKKFFRSVKIDEVLLS